MVSDRARARYMHRLLHTPDNFRFCQFEEGTKVWKWWAALVVLVFFAWIVS